MWRRDVVVVEAAVAPCPSNLGGGAQESNLPETRIRPPHAGFENRGPHQSATRLRAAVCAGIAATWQASWSDRWGVPSASSDNWWDDSTGQGTAPGRQRVVQPLRAPLASRGRVVRLPRLRARGGIPSCRHGLRTFDPPVLRLRARRSRLRRTCQLWSCRFELCRFHRGRRTRSRRRWTWRIPATRGAWHRSPSSGHGAPHAPPHRP